MGCYMNGFGEGLMGKEDVLMHLHGAKFMTKPSFVDPSTGQVTICVVDNGFMQAVAVAYSQEEFDEFNNSDDLRPKMFFTLERSVVEQFADFSKYYTGDHSNKYVK